MSLVVLFDIVSLVVMLALCVARFFAGDAPAGFAWLCACLWCAKCIYADSKLFKEKEEEEREEIGLKIKKNERNGVLYCYFDHDGKEYYAEVSSWPGLTIGSLRIYGVVDGWIQFEYPRCLRNGIHATPAGLRDCIKEFIVESKARNL